MSSSRPPDQGPEQPQPRPRRLTLRTKLVLWIVGLIVAISVVIGVVTEVVLSGYLLQQLDNRVSPGPGPSRPPQRGLPTCGSEIYRPNDNSLAVLISADGSATGTVRQGRVCQVLSADQLQPYLAIPRDGRPVTVNAAVGDYRVAAHQEADGDVVINGVSTADMTATQVRLAVIMACVAGGAILLGGAAVVLIVRRSVRPLERVAATARAVSALPLAKGEVDLQVRVPHRDTDPRTEIGQVGAALNQMLGHVSSALQSRHASETRVRQFVADASHELRTPLAAIRGYAELARRGEHDPAAVAHALRRVESESARMTTLVEDLLLLARLDSGRPLDRQQVDLTALVIDRVSDARVAGPDHRWRLELPDEPVTVTGDPARLHQVLANLLTNARNHTPPGTVVVTALKELDDGVELTVTDNGPGIPADLQPEIFGRFVRGDSSRSRAAGSTGLGLAIVAAVIGAHGGTVEVDSRPGRTVATVWLPSGSSPTTPTAVPVSQPVAR